MLMASPYLVGRIEILRSNLCPERFTCALPSCGSLFSAMSSPDIILILLVIPSLKNLMVPGIPASYRIPSTLYLTLMSFSYGSMWISVALSLMASASI